jgi:hypothetical protein
MISMHWQWLSTPRKSLALTAAFSAQIRLQVENGKVLGRAQFCSKNSGFVLFYCTSMKLCQLNVAGLRNHGTGSTMNTDGKNFWSTFEQKLSIKMSVCTLLQ